jgi:hypothetical protein
MAKKIILVHGLGGAFDETWGKFPAFLEADDDLDFSVVSYGYESPHILKQFWQRAPSILNIANGLLADIKSRCDLDNDEIILAGHSLGGLVVKKLLLRMKDKKISHNIRKICFFDVPHDGSGFANVGKFISFRNYHLKSLCRDSSELDELNDQWVDSGLDNALDILSIVAANDDIVSSSSSKSIFRYHKVETINDVNHRSIVKPESTNSSSYIVFKKFILEKNTVNRFKNIASRDLNDWKRIERNHSYQFVSDKKRDKDFKSLVDALDLNHSVVRLTGASGLGKTRLLLESIDASSTIDDNCVLVFNAPGYEKDIKESIRRAVEGEVHGLAVIENCSVSLHNELAKEVNKIECFLKVVTLGYSHEQVAESIQIQLSPLSDEAIKGILSPILVGLDATNVDRVARFAQGYPLMATLIAEQYQREGRLLGSIEDSTVVRKLIEGDGGASDDEKEVLSACSLFDVFGTAEGVAGEEAKFIAETVAGSTLKIFDRVLRIFSARQIIHRAGRYARVIPKPLALTLASVWWEETSYDRQKQLIDNLPDSLMQSFCIQASYLDTQPSVQRFSERLFGGQSPFVQAGELLTERGSKLFRAFVEVNPESTSHALFRTLSVMTRDELFEISGDTRRDLVWGLEKLCFHASVFEESSWCMLLLASAENETWSNNATGMFAQLFQIHLSGTEASPDIRFDVLRRAIDLNRVEIDMVVLEALSQSISTYGGTRTVGAEYQGTKTPLEEWRPELWQEVFDYWQESFNLLILLFERGEAQKEKVLSEIGHSIRGFVNLGRLDMLDSAIKHIVSINGRYWPAALDNIKSIFEYDSEGMKEETVEVLNRWLQLLSPDEADLPEKLKILVINPPWEHRKGDDGQYIDVASENAKSLSFEVAKNLDELMLHLDLLLQGEQKQSYSFGYQLAHILPDVGQLLEQSFKQLLVADPSNPSFILGIYRGIFERSPEQWQENVDRLLVDERLVSLYPDVIRTGDIQKSHLDELLKLIGRGGVSSTSVNALSYGSVTAGIDPETMVEFCLSLSTHGDKASWSALNVIYMYCFGNKGSIEVLREPLKKLVVSVPLYKKQRATATDTHHWRDLAEKLLQEPDEQFAIALTKQLIAACQHGLNHSDIWHYTKPLLLDLMREYGDSLWPIFGDAIVQSKGMVRYWLQQLLDRENSFSNQMPSVLSVVPVESVISWCQEQPDLGPTFVASCVNIFETVEEKLQPSDLFVALLARFGADEQVISALGANIGTRSWSGSLVPYLEADRVALSPLLEHENGNVRRWVKDHIAYIMRQIEAESIRDEERGIGRF